MKLDHIGIATKDATGLAETYTQLFDDLDIVHHEEYNDMYVVFIELETGYFEVLEPIETETPIGSYLADNDHPLHHVAFEVDNIEKELSRLQTMNIALLDDTPRKGAWGHTIAFIHPSETGGILTELVEH
ncbi:MAG: methylmalonyl-CoA epimerase [Halobacteriaceae archaeon]